MEEEEGLVRSRVLFQGRAVRQPAAVSHKKTRDVERRLVSFRFTPPLSPVCMETAGKNPPQPQEARHPY